jgi:hypothetical protein
MKKLNLLLKFKLISERRFQVRGAARIKMDCDGLLTVYDAETGVPENIALAEVETISILPFFQACNVA